MTDRHSREAIFADLLRSAGARAETMLRAPSDGARIRAIGDDGFTEIERLELSPMAEDQLVAVALRLAGHAAVRPLSAALSQHFDQPASAIAVEAQRRNVWSDVERAGLPFEKAGEVVELFVRHCPSGHEDPDALMRAHAALYADLWGDPRIGATAAARRVMLAMVTVLHERSLELEAGAGGGAGRAMTMAGGAGAGRGGHG